jgi:uncharacterized protein (TIGR00369 family)
MTFIYKICPEALWREAERAGVFTGAPVDLSDGYIHFSTAEQMVETAQKHFKDQKDLLLLIIDQNLLGPALRYEPSRGGALFPHLYGPLPLEAVRNVVPLPLDPKGSHVFPPLESAPASSFDPAGEGWVLKQYRRGLLGALGPLWEKQEADALLHGFLAEERHLNPLGVVHGGMLMTFADHALTMVANAASGGRAQATIQLDTHFVDGVREGEFVVAQARVVRQTRSMMFMSAALAVGSRAVATSNGIWKLRSS